MKDKNEGVVNWSKAMRPSVKDYKVFCESNNRVEHKDAFLVTVDAQNLNHLIDSNHKVIDMELDGAQWKYMHKVLKDAFLHHEAKTIIKAYAKTKDTRLIWKKIWELYDDLITTSMNGDAILAWLWNCKFHQSNWNKPHGELITYNQSQRNKFNEICPESALHDNHSVRMLQNMVSGTPHFAPVLNVNWQVRKAAGNATEPNFNKCCALLQQ